MRGGSRTQASWFTSQTSWGEIFYFKGQVIYSSLWESKAVHRQHSWWAVMKSFLPGMVAAWGAAPVKVTSPGGSCATLLPVPVSSCPVPACFSNKQGQISTCPHFCGSWGLVWDDPSTSLSDLIFFCCHPSVSMATLPAAQPPVCCMCAASSFCTPYLIFWVFSSAYIFLCFPSETVPLLTMSLLCCHMNSWAALSGWRSCTNNPTLFSHTVSWCDFRNSCW